MTIESVSHLTVYVENQEQARLWYVEKLGFEVVMDNSEVVPNMRWLTVSPPGNQDIQFALVLPQTEDEKLRIGNNLDTVLRTNDCQQEIAALKEKGVEIVNAPVEVPWGWSANIRDLYGNPYNIVGPKLHHE